MGKKKKFMNKRNIVIGSLLLLALLVFAGFQLFSLSSPEIATFVKNGNGAFKVLDYDFTKTTTVAILNERDNYAKFGGFWDSSNGFCAREDGSEIATFGVSYWKPHSPNGCSHFTKHPSYIFDAGESIESWEGESPCYWYCTCCGYGRDPYIKMSVKKGSSIIHNDKIWDRGTISSYWWVAAKESFAADGITINKATSTAWTCDEEGDDPLYPCQDESVTMPTSISLNIGDRFDINFSEPEYQYFEDSKVVLDFTIFSNVTYPVKTNATIEFVVYTSLEEPAKSTYRAVLDVNPGNNEYTYLLPTSELTTKLLIKPKLDIIIPGNRFEGLLTKSCYEQLGITTNVENCQYIYVGTHVPDEKEIRINPKPLWLEVPNAGCDSLEGYTLNVDGSFCIRNDIADLSCMQLGCPDLPGHEYSCMSSGFCSELVYGYRGCQNDSECPEGAVCEATIENDTVCITEEIQENLVFIPEPEEVRLSCDAFNWCAEGYTCVDKDFNGNPIATCVQDEKTTDWSNTMMYVFIIGAVLLIGGVIYVASRKKKRSKKKGRK